MALDSRKRNGLLPAEARLGCCHALARCDSFAFHCLCGTDTNSKTKNRKKKEMGGLERGEGGRKGREREERRERRERERDRRTDRQKQTDGQTDRPTEWLNFTALG